MESAALGALLYGRMETTQQAYFDAGCGQHSRIRLRESPHYLFWRDGELAGGGDAYRRFLACSVDAASADARIEAFCRLKDQCLTDGQREPITLLSAPDGKDVLVDGHHRAAIAYAFGRDVDCVRLDLPDGLNRIVSNQAEFYGTRNANRPYQSIFYGNRELVAGRRRDVLERFLKLDILDHVRGKTVLDLGSNIGVNAMLAWHFGARSVTAVEVSPTIASAALQIATVLDAQVKLRVHDLGQALEGVPPCDTVLCYSLFAHVSDKAALAESIDRLTLGTLYFEGHENSRAEDYELVLGRFRSVEQIGFNSDGAHSTAATRPFFRCTR